MKRTALTGHLLVIITVGAILPSKIPLIVRIELQSVDLFQVPANRRAFFTANINRCENVTNMSHRKP